MTFQVKIVTDEEVDMWFDFVKKVDADFYNLNLSRDDKFRQGMLKNIKRGSAISVNAVDGSIIGALTYSTNQNHISWLAVDPSYRRKGIASMLMTYTLDKLSIDQPVIVKTFLLDDEYGLAARCFYKNHGFIPKEKIMKEVGFPHPIQIFERQLKQ